MLMIICDLVRVHVHFVKPLHISTVIIDIFIICSSNRRSID